MHKILPFLVFFIVANPKTFKLVRGILGSWVASADGLPTQAGVLLHALVFVIATHIAWKLLKVRKSGYLGKGKIGAACSGSLECMYGCVNGVCT